jgi:hypothetical protein
MHLKTTIHLGQELSLCPRNPPWSFETVAIISMMCSATIISVLKSSYFSANVAFCKATKFNA